jgi:hypothetical protein
MFARAESVSRTSLQYLSEMQRTITCTLPVKTSTRLDVHIVLQHFKLSCDLKVDLYMLYHLCKINDSPSHRPPGFHWKLLIQV